MVDAIPGGLKIDESLEVAKMIEADGTLDALVLTGGSSYGNPMFLFKGDGPRKDFAAHLPPFLRLGFKLVGKKFMPDLPFEEAYFESMARRYLDELDLPVILLGGINRLDTIEKSDRRWLRLRANGPRTTPRTGPTAKDAGGFAARRHLHSLQPLHA